MGLLEDWKFWKQRTDTYTTSTSSNALHVDVATGTATVSNGMYVTSISAQPDPLYTAISTYDIVTVVPVRVAWQRENASAPEDYGIGVKVAELVDKGSRHVAHVIATDEQNVALVDLLEAEIRSKIGTRYSSSKFVYVKGTVKHLQA